jgi:hypothetical protein
VFNLTAGADQAVFDDDGVAANNTSQLRSNNGTFETTMFGHPASSLTLNAGAGDSPAVDFLDSLGTADLTIGSLTSAAARPDSIRVNNVVTSGTVNLAATGLIGELVFDVAPDIVANAAALLAGGNIDLDLQVSTVAAANTGSGFIEITTPAISWSALSAASPASPPCANRRFRRRESQDQQRCAQQRRSVHLGVGAGAAITNNAAVSPHRGSNTVTLKGDRMVLAAGTISAVAGSVILTGLRLRASNRPWLTDRCRGRHARTVRCRARHDHALRPGIVGNDRSRTSRSAARCTATVITATLALTGALSGGTSATPRHPSRPTSPYPILALDASESASTTLDNWTRRAPGVLQPCRCREHQQHRPAHARISSSTRQRGTTTTISTSSPLSDRRFVTSVRDLTLTAADSAVSGDDLTIAFVGGFSSTLPHRLPAT